MRAAITSLVLLLLVAPKAWAEEPAGVCPESGNCQKSACEKAKSCPKSATADAKECTAKECTAKECTAKTECLAAKRCEKACSTAAECPQAKACAAPAACRESKACESSKACPLAACDKSACPDAVATDAGAACASDECCEAGDCCKDKPSTTAVAEDVESHCPFTGCPTTGVADAFMLRAFNDFVARHPEQLGTTCEKESGHCKSACTNDTAFTVQQLHHLHQAAQHLAAAGLEEEAEELVARAGSYRSRLLEEKMAELARLQAEIEALESEVAGRKDVKFRILLFR